MTRWEYSRADSLDELNELGAMGWEVYGIISEKVYVGDGELETRTIHYLKRPRP